MSMPTLAILCTIYNLILLVSSHPSPTSSFVTVSPTSVSPGASVTVSWEIPQNLGPINSTTTLQVTGNQSAPNNFSAVTISDPSQTTSTTISIPSDFSTGVYKIVVQPLSHLKPHFESNEFTVHTTQQSITSPMPNSSMPLTFYPQPSIITTQASSVLLNPVPTLSNKTRPNVAAMDKQPLTIIASAKNVAALDLASTNSMGVKNLDDDNGTHRSLSSGAVVGICISIILFWLLIFVILSIVFCKKRLRAWKRNYASPIVYITHTYTTSVDPYENRTGITTDTTSEMDHEEMLPRYLADGSFTFTEEKPEIHAKVPQLGDGLYQGFISQRIGKLDVQ